MNTYMDLWWDENLGGVEKKKIETFQGPAHSKNRHGRLYHLHFYASTMT